jgi:hypothetical protein
MRQRKLDLRARVNGDLQLEFEDVALTSYAGLELFARYLRRTGFNTMVREAFAGTTRWGDYGVVAMIRLLLGLLIICGRRLRHIAYVQDDPLVRRFAGVRLCSARMRHDRLLDENPVLEPAPSRSWLQSVLVM